MKRRKFMSLYHFFGVIILIDIVVTLVLAISCIAVVNFVFDLSIEFPLITWLFIFAVGVGAAVTIVLSMFIIKPVRKLQIAMGEVSNGNFNVRLPSQNLRIGDLVDLYERFNQMTKELQATEILQTDFVSNVSHEIKTPINAIEGYATLLQGDDLNPDQKEYVSRILFNTKRLSELVGNILLLSKVENQSISFRKTNYWLDEQVRQVILFLEPKWIEKDIEFDVEMDSIMYYGDESILFHVWSNLIGNAIKFGPREGTITIRMTQKNDKIEFFVKDEGPGIADKNKKHIFDKFYQEDSSHKQEGNGLGLCLVKQILNLVDGTIFVESKEGHGCKFIVQLPR